MTATLQADGIAVTYGRAQALKPCSFAVDARQILGVFGINGAGKSSLLRALAGVQACQGTVRLDGTDISGWRAERRTTAGVAFVPEGRHVFPALTVAENLRLGGYGLSRRDRERATSEVCELFPVLAERRDSLAGTLSGGQQKMLSIGRALMREPRVLLLDEPSFGLAPTVVETLYARLRDLKQRDVAIVLVEQQIERARALVDRALTLHLGETVAIGGVDVLSADDLFLRRSPEHDGAGASSTPARRSST